VYAARYDAARATSPYIVFPSWSDKDFVENETAKEYSKFDAELPVYLAIDPGGTYAVAAIQMKLHEGCTNSLTKGYDLCIIDELYYQTTVTTEEVFTACSQREWWPNLNRVDHSWWPSMQGAIDSTANEQARIWQHLGRRDSVIKSLHLNSRKGNIIPGIETLQHFLDTHSIWVNPSCMYWKLEMRKYQYQSPGFSNAGVEDPRKRVTPKDAWNHLIKAVIYFITCRFGYYGRENENHVLTRDKLNELYYFNVNNEIKKINTGRAVVSRYGG